jgi:hypothetical protein
VIAEVSRGQRIKTPSFGRSLRTHGTGQEEEVLHGVAFSPNLLFRGLEELGIGVQLQSYLICIHELYTKEYTINTIFTRIIALNHNVPSFCPVVSSSYSL